MRPAGSQPTEQDNKSEWTPRYIEDNCEVRIKGLPQTAQIQALSGHSSPQ